jgi:SNF2 family DNA or RNA helicase
VSVSGSATLKAEPDEYVFYPSYEFKNADKTAGLKELTAKSEEVVAEGHKTIIFSQFTSFLELVKQALAAKKWRYSYLDGATADRRAAIDEFQKNADVPLFLLSLKAGGVGLNLTAADYCIILDPWWNPAVEDQAIARAHRMGQTRPVMVKVTAPALARAPAVSRILTLRPTGSPRS